MNSSDKVIVLKTVRYSDDDLIIHGLNSQGAKISFFAKSALKSKKRFGGGVLEPTHYIQAQYRKKSEDSALSTLLEAKLLEAFEGLRKDYERLETALYFLSLVDRVSHAEDSKPLFDLLGNALRAAETCQAPTLLKLHFEYKLLSLQGVLPQIQNSEIFLRPLRDNDHIRMEHPQRHQIQNQVSEVLTHYLS